MCLWAVQLCTPKRAGGKDPLEMVVRLLEILFHSFLVLKGSSVLLSLSKEGMSAKMIEH